MRLLKVFVKPDDKLILFSSYSGKRYDDSPKDIYEAMTKDYRFDRYELVWAFKHPEEHSLKRARTIKVDTLNYFITALKARVWITNVSITRGLYFKGANTFSLNTWHGTPIKFIGKDVTKGGGTFITKAPNNTTDIQIAQGEYEKNIYSKAFGINPENVLVTGWPRNDSLIYDNTPERISEIRNAFGVPKDKKVILYAPTYRDYEKDNGNNCILRPPFNFHNWKDKLGDEYILFIRAHQEVVNVLDLVEDNFVRNASAFPILNDLLLITDVLISDYSGIIFDYSILGRPIFAYTYDFDIYKKARGMYFDIRNELVSTDNEDTLISMIRDMNVEQLSFKSKEFREKYIQLYGGSSQRVLDIIYDKICV